MGKKFFNKDYLKNLREQSNKIYYEIPALNWGEMVDGKYTVSERYNFNWKYATGERKILTPLGMDLYDYIKNFQASCALEGKRVLAYVGTDSQNHLQFTRFVTVICLQVEGNGVHVLVSRMDMPKMYEYSYRLLRETDITAEFVRKHKEFFQEINMPLEVHADYNNQTNHKSNGVVEQAKNYMKTYGFNLHIKPESWSASYGADYWV